MNISSWTTKKSVNTETSQPTSEPTEPSAELATVETVATPTTNQPTQTTEPSVEPSISIEPTNLVCDAIFIADTEPTNTTVVVAPVPPTPAKSVKQSTKTSVLVGEHSKLVKDVIEKFNIEFPSERDLVPTARKSFYGKGKVVENNRYAMCVSYFTPIAVYDKQENKVYKLCGVPSKTTGSHLKAFWNDQNLPLVSSQQWESQAVDAILTTEDLNKLV